MAKFLSGMGRRFPARHAPERKRAAERDPTPGWWVSVGENGVSGLRPRRRMSAHANGRGAQYERGPDHHRFFVLTHIDLLYRRLEPPGACMTKRWERTNGRTPRPGTKKVVVGATEPAFLPHRGEPVYGRVFWSWDAQKAWMMSPGKTAGLASTRSG